MMLEQVIRSELTADAGLTALIGDRIGPEPSTRKVDAAHITFERVSSSPTTYVDGTLEQHDAARIVFNVWAEKVDQVIDIVEALIAAVYASSELAGTLQNQESVYDSDGRRRGMAVDFLMWCSRS